RRMAVLHEAATTCDIILSVLRRFPARVAFRMDGQDLTYGQTEDILRRWVAVLHQRGFEPGQGVGLLSLNRPEAWFPQVAPVLAGGRYTALHPLGSLDDHLHACNEAELKFLFVDPAFAERAVALKEKAQTVEAVFSFGPSEAGDDIEALAVRARVNGGLEPGPA